MIPLGPIEFSPADVALILAVLALGATALALPATLTLAWVGHRRATVHKGWNAIWYWFCGTGLSVGTTLVTATYIRWWAVPVGWVPSLVVAWALDPRWTRRRASVGIHDDRAGGAMSDNGDRPTRQRVTLSEISSRAWEHPADRGALVALRQLKGFDYVLRKMSGLINERAFRLQYLGSAIRVDERQFPTVNRLYTEAASTLDVRELPELFVTNSPIWNAVTIGMDKPFIVVNSALLTGLDEEELRFVLGHELGHAQSGHALYQSLLMWLMRLTGAFNWMPIGALGLRAIIAALHEWSRKAELSGDRAGLLATQDPAVALRVQMKLASGGQLNELDTTAFLAQGTEYESAGDLRDSVLKLLLLEAQSHPLAVIRAHELRRWVDEGEYTAIVSGEYPKRQDDGDASISQEAKNAAKSYSDAFSRSQDPLAKLLRDLGDGLGGVRDWVSSKFPPR